MKNGRWPLLAALFSFSFLASCDQGGEETASAPPAMTEEAGTPPAPLGPLGDAVVPSHYRLDMTIVPAEERFGGDVAIDVRINKPLSAIFLHGRDLDVSLAEAVLADGRKLAAAYIQLDRNGTVRLDFKETLPVGPAVLHFVFTAPFGTQLAGLYKVMDQGDAYAFTQFESTSARRAFPSFDEPAFKTPFDLTITTSDANVAVSAAPILRKEPLGNGMTRIVFATTKPLPAYLMTLLVGPFDVVEADPIPASPLRAEPIPLRGITVRGKGDRIRYALANTAKIVLIEEEYFGHRYPFDKLDIVAVADFAAGAMENAGAITYRETLILLDESAGWEQKRRFFLVHAHELAHMWVGDLVTPKWWDDIWLNESFADWMDSKAAALARPDSIFGREIAVGMFNAMDLDVLDSSIAIRQPVPTTDDIGRSFSAITYDKGAAVLSMFESYLGEEKFRDGIRAYMNRFAYKTAVFKDLFDTIAETSGQKEILDALGTFVNQPGVPVVILRTDCEGEPRRDLAQHAYAALGRTAPARSWQVPVCIRDLAGGETECALLADAIAAMPVKGDCTSPVMPNAHGKGYYRFELDAAGWNALVAASDRLDAAEKLALLNSVRGAFRAGSVDAQTYLAAVAGLAGDPVWDIAYRTTLLFAELRGTLVAGGALAAFETKLRSLYQARFAALGLQPAPGESENDTLLRGYLAAFVAKTARAPEVLSALAARGRRIMGLDGAPAPEWNAIAPDLREYALWAAARTGGAQAGRALIGLFARTNDQQIRRDIVEALPGIADPAVLQEALDLLLSQDLRTNEATRLEEAMFREPDTRGAMWEWVKQNYDAYAKRLTEGARTAVVRDTKYFCTKEMAEDVRAFYETKLQSMQGGELALSTAIEQIENCAALKAARGAEVAAWFE